MFILATTLRIFILEIGIPTIVHGRGQFWKYAHRRTSAKYGRVYLKKVIMGLWNLLDEEKRTRKRIYLPEI